MDEQSFFKHCDQVFTLVEDTLDSTDLDCDIARQDRVLEISFENGSKLILSANEPVKELWLAARSGGFHYRWADGQWCDTRSKETLSQALGRCVAQQTGLTLQFDLS